MSMKIGPQKWTYWGMMAAYVFLFWFIISAILVIFLTSFWSLIVNVIVVFVFYDQLDRRKHRETEQVYKVAGLSKWIDNVLYVNDKGSVVINQDRITEVIPLDVNARVIKDINEKDSDFLRIKASIIADSKYVSEEYPEYEDNNSEVKNNINQLERIDENKIASMLGVDDPRKFKFKFFIVANVIPRGKSTVFECSKKMKKGNKNTESEQKVPTFAEHKKALDELSKELDEKEPDSGDDLDDLDELDDKDDAGKEPEDEEDEEDKKDDPDEDADSSSVTDDEKKSDEEKEDDEPTVVDSSLAIPDDDVKSEEIEYDEAEDDEAEKKVEYKEVTVKSANRLTGKWIDRARRYKYNVAAFSRGLVFRIVENDDILDVLDKFGIYTIEQLRGCDKMAVSDKIGITSAEMYEFVKYCEDSVKERAIKYWDDLTPKELKKVCLIKMVEVQIKQPRDYIYLVTYAEPKELITGANILARPFSEVNEVKSLEGEIVKPVKRRFDQAVYIMEDEYENCLNFMPGGTGYLNHYPVYVPLAYATFVLKGWIGTAIPILKLIATNYEVQREFDDYKNHLSHDNVMIKAMAGLVNHMRSNMALYPQQLESNKHDIETMKDELDRLNQMKLQQIYMSQGSIIQTSDIQNAYGLNDQKKPDERQKTKGKLGKYIWIVLGILGLLLAVLLIR